MSAKKIRQFSLFILIGGLFCVSLPVNIAAQLRGEGWYVIVAKHSGKVLDVRLDTADSARLNGTAIQQYHSHSGDNQKFYIRHAVGSTVYYSIKPKSGYSFIPQKCLDIPGFANGVIGVQQYDCNNGTNQQFAIESVGCYYRIRVRSSGKYFDIEAISLDDRARLNQYAYNGGDNQLFQFIKVPS